VHVHVAACAIGIEIIRSELMLTTNAGINWISFLIIFIFYELSTIELRYLKKVNTPIVFDDKKYDLKFLLTAKQ
jgi:hypothetical protein